VQPPCGRVSSALSPNNRRCNPTASSAGGQSRPPGPAAPPRACGTPPQNSVSTRAACCASGQPSRPLRERRSSMQWSCRGSSSQEGVGRPAGHCPPRNGSLGNGHIASREERVVVTALVARRQHRGSASGTRLRSAFVGRFDLGAEARAGLIGGSALSIAATREAPTREASAREARPSEHDADARRTPSGARTEGRPGGTCRFERRLPRPVHATARHAEHATDRLVMKRSRCRRRGAEAAPRLRGPAIRRRKRRSPRRLSDR
jgi:hypothetical protein